jgi:hypothetical protein
MNQEIIENQSHKLKVKCEFFESNMPIEKEIKESTQPE